MTTMIFIYVPYTNNENSNEHKVELATMRTLHTVASLLDLETSFQTDCSPISHIPVTNFASSLAGISNILVSPLFYVLHEQNINYVYHATLYVWLLKVCIRSPKETYAGKKPAVKWISGVILLTNYSHGFGKNAADEIPQLTQKFAHSFLPPVTQLK
uniref:Uncharacterized protein n=1 Tax=Glossina pallidipes TaxID=7398 RepID=A0A1A9ZFP3_GLOPL